MSADRSPLGELSDEEWEALLREKAKGAAVRYVEVCRERRRRTWLKALEEDEERLRRGEDE